LVEGAREEILSGFYERALGGFSEEVREFVEDRLLTVTGARDRYALENALTQKGIDQSVLSTLINRRLLRKEVADKKIWLELTPDTIADVARTIKRAREERKRAEAASKEAEQKIKAAEATAAESRKQAKNTDRRTEGFFRKEWGWAEDRMLGFRGSDRPFLMPVIIDQTNFLAAKIPESFETTQYTKLVDGVLNSTFVQAVKQKLEELQQETLQTAEV
jgi:hypothetical protein